MGETYFDQQLADRIVRLFESLKLSTPENYGKRLKLLDYQRNFLTKVLATKEADTHRRKIKEACLTIPVQNGKTTTVSLLALWFLTAPECQGYHVLSAAPTHKQARIVYDNIMGMIEQNPTLKAICIPNSKDGIITNKRTGARFRSVANKSKNASGFSADVVIVDEAAEFEEDSKLFEVLRSRTRARTEPLVVTLSTAGWSPNPEFWFYDKYLYAKKVRDGIIKNDEFLPAIYEADEKDDPFEEATWYKANPSLGIVAKLEDVRRAAEEAKNSSRALARFRRDTLNQWRVTDDQWLEIDLWNAAKDGSIKLEQFRGRSVYLGIDAAANVDLCAISVIVPLPNGEYRTIPYFFIPKDIAAQREATDAVPYREWINKGHVIATNGATTDFESMRKVIFDISKVCTIRRIGIDRRFLGQFANELQTAGFPVVEVLQGYKMSPAFVELERMLMAHKFWHPDNECLNWCFSNCIAQHGYKNDVMLIKKGMKFKIDGIVATGIALATCIDDAESTKLAEGKKVSNKVRYVSWV